MADFAGISKDDKNRLKEAATMYRNLTGKDVSGVVANIPAKEDDNTEAEQVKAKADLERQAEITRKMEQAQQEFREASMPKSAKDREDAKKPVETDGAAQERMEREKDTEAESSRERARRA